MTPKCSACGSEQVVWAKTKQGYPVLMDASVPHRFKCAKRPKLPAEQAEAIGFLRALKYTATEAREMVKRAKAKDTQGILAEVLKGAGQ